MTCSFTKHLVLLVIFLTFIGCGGTESTLDVKKPEPETPQPETPEPETPEPETPEPETPEPETPEPETPEPETPSLNAPCQVNYDDWLKLERLDSLAKINNKFSCNGFTSSVSSNSDGTNAVYHWGNNLEKPTILLALINNKLSASVYQLYDVPFSSCLPDEKKIKTIKNEQSKSEAEKNLGCTGIYNSSYSYGDDEVFKQYKWERSDSKTVLTVDFDKDNKIVSHSYTMVEDVKYSLCQPTYNKWDSLLIQETYKNTIDKLGCEGVKNISDEELMEWGKSDGSTDRVLVRLWQGYIAAKQFVAKDSLSNCTPHLIDGWQSIRVGDTYESVKNIMECDGILETSLTTSNNMEYATNTYVWKNALNNQSYQPINGISYKVILTRNKVVGKQYMNYIQPFSICEPTLDNYYKIKIGDKWTDVQGAYGCPARLNLVAEDGRKSYAFGSLKDNKKTTYAYVDVDARGIVANKLVHFKP